MLMKHGAVVGKGFGLVILVFLCWRVISRGLSPDPAGILLAILDGANLIFHEAGHVFFSFFGDFLQYLGGSLFQVALPLALTFYFWRNEQCASASVTLFWTGENLTNVAIYIADAKWMALPLIGGDHDWNYLLGRLGLLNQAESLGRFVFVLGVFAILFSLALLIGDVARSWKEAQVGQ
ncbi:MAG: hypothetical protein HYT78_21385 [Deltaproteobacteria bacterium]|nr:hypothetical protein [Deltaproteobacteria bacterium]